MANYTTYGGGEVIANKAGANAAGYPATTVLVAEFDASKRNLATGDTVDIASLPNGVVVNSVVLEVVTADAGGGSIAVGTSAGTPAALVAATAVASAGRTLGAGAGVGTLIEEADDTIRLTASVAGMTTLKCKVYADVTILG